MKLSDRIHGGRSGEQALPNTAPEPTDPLLQQEGKLMEPPSGDIVDDGITIFIWFFVGILVLWVVATMGERVGRMLMPSLPFIIGAVLIGALAVAAFNKIF
jgi:hypothetical protein